MKSILGGSRYASITATLALAVALGGTSYAAISIPKNSVGSPQIIKEGVKSSDVKNDGLKGKDIKESTLAEVPAAAQLGGKTLRGLSQWVLVDTAGGILSQSGQITVAKLAAAGRYRVTFASDITACGLNVNVTSAAPQADLGTFSPSMAMVGRSTTGAKDAQVLITTDDGTAADRPFYLTAQC